MKFNFFTGRKKRARKHKKHVRKIATAKSKAKSQPKTDDVKATKSKEMILSPGKGAPLFIADAKGEAVEGELLDADGQYLLQKLGKETSISSYVYVIPAGKGRPAMVDLTIDGVWGFVRICAEKKIVSLKITEARVEDVVSKTKRGETLNLVRAIVKCEDENGFTHFAVKEEPRYKERAAYDKSGKYIGKEIKYDPHSATMVLEKAQKKAIISHPSFPRIEAREFVKRQLLENKDALLKLGINPETLLPSGGIKAGRGKFSDVFYKGKIAGLTADETRKKIAAGGQRLSESRTVGDVAGALKAIDSEVVDTKTGEINEQPAGTTPPPSLATPPAKPEAKPKPAKRFLANIKFPEGIPDGLSQHLDYVLTFGKFKERSLRQILETNADYLRWFSDDCQSKIAKGERISELGNGVLIHLNPIFLFLKENGLVKTEKSASTE